MANFTVTSVSENTVAQGSDPWEGVYMAEARSLLGITDQTLRRVWSSDFVLPTDYSILNNNATNSTAVSGPPGILEINNGGGTNKEGAIVSPPGLTATQYGASVNSKRWYWISLAKISSAAVPNSNSRFLWGSIGGLLSANTFVAAGYNGQSSTAHLGFSAGTTDGGNPLCPTMPIASTVTPDLDQWIACRVWNDLEYVRGRFNTETAVVITPSSSLTSSPISAVYLQSQPFATGQADKFQIDKVLFAVEE